MKIQIELYGRLRDAGLGAWIELEVPEAATAAQVLEKLGQALGPKAELLKGAVLANESAVLEATERATYQRRLAALPPVCGG